MTRSGCPRSLATLSDVAVARGDLTAGELGATEALTLTRQLDDRINLAARLTVVAAVALDRGDLRTAAACCAEAVIVARDLGQKAGVATAVESLARMRVADAWEQTIGSEYISVAVLDTGFESTNVEIRSNYDAVHLASFAPCSDGGQPLDCTLDDTATEPGSPGASLEPPTAWALTRLQPGCECVTTRFVGCAWREWRRWLDPGGDVAGVR